MYNMPPNTEILAAHSIIKFKTKESITQNKI